ncbi:MAG: FxsA family protein [Planctomycetota bacterium]|nr:MAG: FxsA family protein [Planctomycetota bacterium]
MFLRLLILLTVVPLVELVILLQLADRFSWQVTLAVILITGLLGAALARREGWRTWRRMQQELESGRIPGDALWDAAMILLAGALLITPGLLTDALGFALLVPPVRRFARRQLSAWFRRRVVVFDAHLGMRRDPHDETFVDVSAVSRPVEEERRSTPPPPSCDPDRSLPPSQEETRP